MSSKRLNKTRAFMYLASFTLLAVGVLALLLLSSSITSPAEACRDVEVVKKLTPLTLGKEVLMTFSFDGRVLKCGILNESYVVAVASDSRLAIVDPDLWDVFYYYCEQHVASTVKAAATTYTMLVIGLVLLAILLAVLASVRRLR